ncbi:MAG: CPBP family intramembrane metalloprotease [Bacteroidales bacterium]|nr:CPBP family intramembrane metalloprotease [Bacteroidales bacterium]
MTYNSNKSAVALLLQLLVLIAVCALAATLLSSLISALCISRGIDTHNNMIYLKSMQTFLELSMFMTPALIFSYKNSQSINNYWGFKQKQSGITIILVIALYFVAVPLVAWLVKINENVRFPESLQTLENALKSIQDSATEMTEKFMNVSTIGGILVNIFVMAIVPAVSEEMLFRGCIQKTLTDKMRNKFLAILISAFIFSAAHLEFYGLLPRFILGIILGYVFYYTGNILMSVLLHFINNSIAVIAGYIQFHLNNGVEPETMFTTPPTWMIVSSAVLTVALLIILGRNRKQEDFISPTS